jgi:hypothetical protein
MSTKIQNFVQIALSRQARNNNFWYLILVVEDKFTLVIKLNIPYAKFQEKILKKFSYVNMIYWEDFSFHCFFIIDTFKSSGSTDRKYNQEFC